VAKKLYVNDGRSERTLLLVANMVVGRDPMCEISDDDALLSRRHAEFVVGGGDVLVRDLGSRNGVYVNGLKVSEKPLRSNDLVRIGHLELRYVEDATPLSAALAAAVADSTAFVPGGAPLGPRPVPASGLRNPADAVDEERTRLVRAPGPQVPTPSTAAEDEYTKVVQPPVSRAPAVSAPAGESDDEERTRLVRPPLSSGSAMLTVAIPPPADTAKPKAAPVPAPRTPESTGFVFAHVGLLAVVVSAAAMAPFLVRGQSPLDGANFAAPGLSVAVIILTTYLLGARIAGRMRAAAGNRDRGAD
jgi:hypothetical protein